MKSFFECNFFNSNEVVSKDFKVLQEELFIVKKEKFVANEKVKFSKIVVEYTCEWISQNNFNNNKATILIPIKDNVDLLNVTISNLKEHDVTSLCNVVIIDDRSKRKNIKKIVKNNGLSYLRVDNKKGFNFSMLNNIPAKICYDMGVKNIILWNSDLWCVKKEWLKDLIDKHNKDENVISGTKLVYPPIKHSMTKTEDSGNIMAHFPHMTGGKWRDTVQFGGDRWNVNKAGIVYFAPDHYGRFLSIDDTRVNCNRGMSFITGAFQIIDLKYFIEIGGLNPSLSKNFQDVDICLRCVKDGKIPMYYGKDKYFYHDESLTFYNMEKSGEGKKIDHQFMNDTVLFGKIWNTDSLTLGLV